ncbi:orotidine-5'-phosphate decarboxylase [Balneicella halophila]|nr:orotidine-5'-phosphate decarboxylase [Balneicella halophila]
MKYQDLVRQIEKKQSFLCVGLDTAVEKMPKHLHQTPDAIFRFNKAIIDATHDIAVAYKPNTAFYEALGVAGWQAFEETVLYIKSKYPEMFVIADAKRGDIGNTSERYAKAFFEQLPCDALTVAPYMGSDSVQPFLTFKDKWVILLALTSNNGATDFQFTGEEKKLFEKVLDTSKNWADEQQLMYVVGATQAEMFTTIRKHVPKSFLLVPGVGAQGGSLSEVAKYGMTKDCGLLVNASRSIIYAGSGHDFAEAARAEAKKMQQEMASLLKEYR